MKKGIVSTDQIYFRPIVIEDIDKGWLDWINNPDSNKFLTHRKPTTKDELIQYLNMSKPPSVYMFAVCMQEDNRYIGNARLSSIDWINRKGAYGRLIGDCNLRGRGIGTEILILLAYYAFYHLNLNRIETGVVKKNIASIRSNEKAGAISEGILREHDYINGSYEDVVRFGILRSDFSKNQLSNIVCVD
jgi:RimJ/RimL family protein N-acetyltransferase